MRLTFFGTSDFAVRSLEALVGAGHSIALVVTRPDRAVGRGRKLSASPVKQAASRRDLSLLQPESINRPPGPEQIRQTKADLGVVVAYGEIIDSGVLCASLQGFINLHASLLPAYRGAAPINWAIMNGESETGVTVVRMVEELDAGPILAQKAVPIEPRQTAGDLHDVLAAAGAQLLTDVVSRLDGGEKRPEREQDAKWASYAPRLTKKDGKIEWSLPAEEIRNRVRGLTPWPGAYCEFAGRSRRERVILLEVDAAGEESVPSGAEIGSVIEVDAEGGVWVKAGQGVIVMRRIKPASGRAMGIADFVRGHRVEAGDRFC